MSDKDLVFEEIKGFRGQELRSPSGNKNLECFYDLSKRNGVVSTPISSSLFVIDKNYELVALALEMNLGLLCFAASHCCCCTNYQF